MACSAQPSTVFCDDSSDERDNQNGCGSDIAFPYFISFYVLCSFLVSIIISPSKSARNLFFFYLICNMQSRQFNALQIVRDINWHDLMTKIKIQDTL